MTSHHVVTLTIGTTDIFIVDASALNNVNPVAGSSSLPFLLKIRIFLFVRHMVTHFTLFPVLVLEVSHLHSIYRLLT